VPENSKTADRWRWTRGPDSTVARTEVAAAIARGSIYVVGGFVPPNRTTDIVERYDLARRRWSRVAVLPAPLNHAAATAYRGHVYVAGGYAAPNGLSEPSRALYRYDPESNHWTKLRSMPTARAAFAFGAINGRLYAAGGADGTRALKTFEVYDIARRRWRRGPDLSIAREHLGGAVVEGQFYAVAGRNQDGNLSIAERFTPGRHAWVRLPDLAKARGGNGAAGWNFGATVFAVGGEEAAGTIGEVEGWGARVPRKSWYELPELPTPRHGLGVVFDESRERLHVIEGGTSPGFSFSKRMEIMSLDRSPD
jgi:Kelch motif